MTEFWFKNQSPPDTNLFVIRLEDEDAARWKHSPSERLQMLEQLKREAWEADCHVLLVMQESTGERLLHIDIGQRIFKTS